METNWKEVDPKFFVYTMKDLLVPCSIFFGNQLPRKTEINRIFNKIIVSAVFQSFFINKFVI